MAGVPKSVIDCRNAIRKPASSAGVTSGSVTSSAVRQVDAPRIDAASSNSLGMTSRLLATNVNTYGNVYSAMTKTMPPAEKMLISGAASNGFRPKSA